MSLEFITSNTILYCEHWNKTRYFYEHQLELKISFINDWFVEFIVNDNARISLADQNRTSQKSAAGMGIMLTFQVNDIDTTWLKLHNNGISPGEIQTHSWGARLFRFKDPEGHRLEIWSEAANQKIKSS